ncbi:hypothetical protein HDU97_002421, partial [Phlyctochytrium planicorne]
YVTSLQNPIDIEIKVKIVSELRDSIEIVQSLEYPRVLALLMPAFHQLLQEVSPVFVSNSPQQKLRNIILEIIHRFPFTDVLRPYASDLMGLLLKILRSDNEENAVICLKITNELQKTFYTVLEEHVQPFLDIVKEMYGNMEKAVEDTFNNPTASATSTTPVSPAVDSNSDESQRPLAPSLFSFKVLTECPIIIALLFSLFKNTNRLVNGNVPQFVPLILSVLTLQPEAQKKAHQEAKENGTIFCGVSSEIKNRTAYSEFKALQVKTVSFVAYILRMFQTTLRPHEETIADAIVEIMKDCPPEAAATRKEILVATRHIWFSEFRAGFTKHIDTLINEDVLIGKGVTCRETLRPLAYSVLVDLILNVRSELSRQQISRIIHIYSKNLHDSSFAPNIQTVCAKLLLNTIDCLVDNSTGNRDGRVLLIRILDTYARKFTALSLSFPSIIKAHMKKKSSTNSTQENFSFSLDLDGFLDLGYVQPIKTTVRMLDTSQDIISDIRLLIKSLIQGFKPILGTLRHYNPPPPQNVDIELYNSVARGFAEEVDIFIRIFRDGLKCFEYYNSDNYGPDGALIEKPTQSLSKDDKEVFEKFAAIFTLVEPCVFQEVFSSQMPLLFERILINPGLQALPQYLLGLVNTAPNFQTAAPNFVNVAPNFAGLLCRFLVDRIEMLGSDDHVFSTAMLRLFKVVFMAVTKYPEKNESVLRPHVSTIITNSMKLSSKSKDPINYFQLLRALFRSIGGGRFEMLYQEVLPLLEVLLEGLTTLLASAHKPQMKELFVELCLTVPVRLSVLLPYLSYLMKPLVLALRAGPELVSQGLRTLELCIDNLTQDFLEPILSPIINDLMSALWTHLQPLPYKVEHSHTTMRILGKLGGRNRRLIGEAFNLQHHKTLENGLECILNFNSHERPQAIALDKVIATAATVLSNATSSNYLVNQAFTFAKSCLPLLIDLENASIDEQLIANLTMTEEERNEYAMEIDGEQPPPTEPSPFIDPLPLPRVKKESFDDTLRKIVSLFFAATNFPHVKDAALDVISNICYQFANVAIAEAIEDNLKVKRKQAGAPQDSLINSQVTRSDGFIDAIVDSFSSESKDQRQHAEKALQFFTNACRSLLSAWPSFKVDDLAVFRTFASRFCSFCYRQEWFKKSGGCRGISFLCSQIDLSPSWILDHELDFVKALLYILKDASPEMATTNIEDATLTLNHVLKVCNHSKEEEKTDSQKAKFNSLMALIVSELSNLNTTVREITQSTFLLLVEITGTDMKDMLKIVSERLLIPIFAKPLRALPFSMQIGHIDAITFCLLLKPPLVEFRDELMRLLHEALALADAEDQALISKPSPRSSIALLTTLRVVCIKLLSAAMTCSEFGTPKQSAFRARIISVFFKSLYVKSPEIVNAAYKGLQQVLAQNFKLPKDLLQAGLRPILVNLSDPKRITVAGLEGLARLLELLTNYFKVEIGRKLLDHLKLWAEPALLEEASGKPLSEIEQVKVMVAIINVFHLLPPTANIFMEDLVKSVIELETQLKRNISSPFRQPLVKFLNRYPAESLTFFLDRLEAVSYSKLFISVLKNEEAAALRQEILNDPAKILQKCFPAPSEDGPKPNDYFSYCGVVISWEMLQYNPDWLSQNEELLKQLRAHWDRILTRPAESLETSNMFLNEYQYLLEIFMHLCKREEFDIDILFDVVKAFNSPELIDVSFVKHFVYNDVLVGFSAAKKKLVLKHFFKTFSGFPVSLRTSSLRMMVIPMLLPSFTQNDLYQIIDADMIVLTHSCIWQPFLTETPENQVDDSFKVELLQLTTLMVRFAPSVINELRKEVIKFAWNHLLRTEDITCKQASYVLLARFIEQYDTPSKIVIQIFVALLRAHQLEGRMLVKQALDILIPVLPRRIPVTANDSRVPLWVRWTRKIIVEDGHSISQLLTIYQLIIRHADLFYKTKTHFIPQIVSSLSKLGLSPNSTPETKTLTVDLAELILQWDKKMLTETDGVDEVAQQEDPGNLSRMNYREILLGYLIRFVCSSNDAGPLVVKSIELMKTTLELWTEIPVKFNHFEKSITNDIKDELAPVITNAAEVLLVVLERKPTSWISSNLSYVQKCLEAWVRFEHVNVSKAVHPIFRKLHQLLHTDKSIKEEAGAEVALFNKLTDSLIAKGLQNLSAPYHGISLLSAAYDFRVSSLEDKAADSLLKLFQKITTDMCSTNPHDPAHHEAAVNVMLMALSFIKVSMPFVKELRKGFFEGLAQLILESSDMKIANKVLEMAKWWILENTEPFPTQKEKANLMVKLLNLESRGDKAFNEEYLTLVLGIYSNPTFARSELTVRLEKAFLWGTRFEDAELRGKFCKILNDSVDANVAARLNYIVGVQNWDHLASYFWIKQAVDLVIGSITTSEKLSACVVGYRVGCEIRGEDAMQIEENKMEVDIEESSPKFQHMKFIESLREMKVSDLLTAIREFSYIDSSLASHLWTVLFPMAWSMLHGNERQLLTKMFVPLLAKDYHIKQADARPNVIQTLVEGLCRCLPVVSLPPVLIKYLGKTFNALYISLEYLHNMVLDQKSLASQSASKDEEKVRDSTMDALGELLAAAAEDDLFFGLIKRRCLFNETNLAASFEQNAMWANAQTFLETAQSKARSGILPFSEWEYTFWEEHWSACAQRLQQWDMLTDLAKHEGNAELLLECAWRLSDWITERDFLQSTVHGLPDGKGCRKKVYEAFLALQNLQNQGGDKEKTHFKSVVEQGMQLALKQWFALPSQVSNAHIPVLHSFQQFVELQEAAQMQENLAGTSMQNIDQKSQELKGLLLTWRERLPNMWDDINIWSDLVAWRQHVFTTINKAYNPLISVQSQNAGAGNPTSSYAYRGYHETAWIINRFSHVARKHQLTDVCISSLSKIYTLPNIEIPEAFYKLREQAKCYFQSPSEYSNGLDVINNTNLQFFSKLQTAEFFSLKGVFLSKLNLHEDANQAFASSVQIAEMKLPKAWAAWGQYNDRMFREVPTDIKFGVHAVTCYLHAAAYYNNARSRKYLARLLWLMSLDDNEQNIGRSFESYKGEVPLWYWITFIPQLLTALANKDSRYAKAILVRLAKTFPQALHFQLRSAKEDYGMIKKHAIQGRPDGNAPPKDAAGTAPSPSGATPEQTDNDPNKPPAQPAAPPPNVPKNPWEHVDEVMAQLKTTYPLLALSMETMVDQMAQRLKPNTDEDIYRLIVALLNDGVQQLSKEPGDSGQICQATESNLARFAESMVPNHMKYKAAFEADFIKSRPSLSQLILKFREWRDKLENLLESRPRKQHLENFSHYLIEFEYQKFDDIEVPGQYFLLKDNSKDFIRIDRFMPEVEAIRTHVNCLRRATVRGHDGSLHTFIIQHPANRHCRREERIVQMFRIFNSILERKKESRRRNLNFHLPLIIPLAPMVRLVQDDPSYVTLQEVFEDHCAQTGMSKDDPYLYYISRMREFYQSENAAERGKVELLNLKTEIMEEISKRMIPDTILSRYMLKKMASYPDLWLMRKQFTAQMAAVTYMTYVVSIGQRYPHKFHISTKTGNIWVSEVQPTVSPSNFLFSNTESVHFRLTPNIQHFITPIGMEGPFTSSIMSIARSLVEPEHELEDYLSIFVKDELIAWQNIGRKFQLQDHQLRDYVNQNVDLVVKRTNAMSCKIEREKAGEANIAANQSLLDLISGAGNPLKLAQMDPTFLAML